MQAEYLSTLREWAHSGRYSDLLLTCHGHLFPVHRVIVCAHSRFFQVACNGNFKESTTNVIDRDDLDSVQRMISYMYTFDYEDEDTVVENRGSDLKEMEQSGGERGDDPVVDDPELFSSVRVYAIAAKYGIAGLKELARTRFVAWMTQNWQSAHCPAMAAEVFESTSTEDMGLRDVVVDIVAQHMTTLVSVAAWQEVITKNDQLGRKILSQLAILQTEMQSKLEDKIKRQATTIDSLLSERDTLTARLAAVSDNLTHHKQCRHCSGKFNVYLESVESATLRCRDCKTRHYSSDVRRGDEWLL